MPVEKSASNEPDAASPKTTLRGSRDLGKLQIAWQAWRTPPSGWHVECALRLGGASEHLELSEITPSQGFELHDGDEGAWGTLKLTPNADGYTAFAIDYSTGSLIEQATTLCIWRVCRACDRVPSTQGGGFLGKDDWLSANWTITGSEDACQKVLLVVTTREGEPIGRYTFTPQQPEHDEVVRHAGGTIVLHFVERFHQDGRVSLEARVRHAQSPTRHERLAELPGDAPGPGPCPSPGPGDQPGNTLILSAPRSFATFAYPRALQPPSPTQLARRFVDVSNTGAFQNQLASLKAKPDRAGMLAEAQDFVAPDSKRYAGQFVARIADLKGAMGRLHGPAVRAFLALHPATLSELDAALAALLGEPVANFLQDPDFPGELARLQDSLSALLVLGARLGRHESALIRALQVCHAAVWVDAQTRTPAGDPPPSPGQLREVLGASLLIPDRILPLPPLTPGTDGGAGRTLGYADIKVIRQQLRRYRLGELAHVENVMRGETKEETRRHSRQTESEQDDRCLSHDSDRRQHEYAGGARQSEIVANNPIGDLKREFDNLKKQYGSDGLSVTVSGGWVDTLDGPASLNDRASAYARQLLDRAAHRVARHVSRARRQRSLEEFSEQKQRRFQNESGDGPLIGFYYWIDEVHTAHLEQVGTRLILECVLSDPAADFLQRNNALHGINLNVPVPPWETVDGVAVTSANDISRANYLALAGRYAADVRPPPPSQRIVHATLSADPPHPLAWLQVPEGYVAASANVAYTWALPPGASGTSPTFDVLVGDVAQKIDTGSDPNPGTKSVASVPAAAGVVPVSVVAAGVAYAVNVGLVCRCPDDTPLFRQWQVDTYTEIMAAYRRRLDETNRVMGRLAEEFLRPGREGRHEAEREELQRGAIQALIKPFLATAAGAVPPLTPDQVEFDLIPFFRQAVEWPEMSFRYFGRYPAGAPKDWLNLIQTVGRDDDFLAFLQAGSAKLLLPVGPGHVLPMLFYLSSNGFFWFGDPALCPVLESDLWLANEWITLRHGPVEPTAKECWEIEVATPMLMLRQDGTLPDFGAARGDGKTGGDDS